MLDVMRVVDIIWEYIDPNVWNGQL